MIIARRAGLGQYDPNPSSANTGILCNALFAVGIVNDVDRVIMAAIHVCNVVEDLYRKTYSTDIVNSAVDQRNALIIAHQRNLGLDRAGKASTYGDQATVCLSIQVVDALASNAITANPTSRTGSLRDAYREFLVALRKPVVAKPPLPETPAPPVPTPGAAANSAGPFVGLFLVALVLGGIFVFPPYIKRLRKYVATRAETKARRARSAAARERRERARARKAQEG